jgi:hypothetical protein
MAKKGKAKRGSAKKTKRKAARHIGVRPPPKKRK